MLFSERHGLKAMRYMLQAETMDDALRNSLWNALTMFPLCHLNWEDQRELGSRAVYSETQCMLNMLWLWYFKEPLDTLPKEWDNVYQRLRKYYFECQWFEVYDFVEFIANNAFEDGDTEDKEAFISFTNAILEEEKSAYRFIGNTLAPISSQVEGAEVEEALIASEPLAGVHAHLKAALELFSDRENPDYRNSIKESISAVEAVARLITGDSQATLGQALRVLETQMDLHPALSGGFQKIYGWTNDSGGIRHAMQDVSTVGADDAKFMLVACSTFVNYLIAKASSAGIELTS